jgi:hypothetical protein
VVFIYKYKRKDSTTMGVRTSSGLSSQDRRKLQTWNWEDATKRTKGASHIDGTFSPKQILQEDTYTPQAKEIATEPVIAGDVLELTEKPRKRKSPRNFERRLRRTD